MLSAGGIAAKEPCQGRGNHSGHSGHEFPPGTSLCASQKMAGCASTSGSVPVLGDRPNQPSSSFKFPKRKFGHAKPVYRTVQPAWFQKWPWLHYDQVGDRMFCYTCVQAYQHLGLTNDYELPPALLVVVFVPTLALMSL